MRPYLLLISIFLLLSFQFFPSAARLHRRQSDVNSASSPDPTASNPVESTSVPVSTDPTSSVVPPPVTPTSSSPVSTPTHTPTQTQDPTTSSTDQSGGSDTTSPDSPTTVHFPPSSSVPYTEAKLTTMLTTRAISTTNANGSVVVVFQTETLTEPLSPSLVDAPASAASRNLAGTKISVIAAVIVGIIRIL